MGIWIFVFGALVFIGSEIHPLSITGLAALDEHFLRTIRVGIKDNYPAEDGAGRVIRGPGRVLHVFQEME